MRELSQVEPMPTVVVTSSGPVGTSWLSDIWVSTCCSSQCMRWAVRNSCSPTSVSTRPRAWRMNSLSARSSSSAEICRD